MANEEKDDFDGIEGEDEVIVFTDEEGNEYEYIVIGEFEFEGKTYAALSENLPEDKDEEEADLAFAEIVGEEYVVVDDETLDQKLFDFFMELLGEEEDECDCDHDGDCDCGCGCHGDKDKNKGDK
ncbi:MAG: DUF1292 domain-containing protein [Christensenellaceae bacterium]|jgi:uncharacterized protein YrzB (UPF0473 family)|nr:DUF1292 domain-containing protein [Christensenellaceae bacterium]